MKNKILTIAAFLLFSAGLCLSQDAKETVVFEQPELDGIKGISLSLPQRKALRLKEFFALYSGNRIRAQRTASRSGRMECGEKTGLNTEGQIM